MKKLNKNYLCAVGYGVFGSLGFYCYIIAAANSISGGVHPYSDPFCRAAGMISLIFCLVLFVLNFHLFLKEKRKGKTFFYEMLITSSGFIGGTVLWTLGERLVSKFLVYMNW